MPEMSKDEIRNFPLQGTFTGKLETINKNGTPHVVPKWFTLDDEDLKKGINRIETVR